MAPSILEEEADKYGVFRDAVGFPTVHWFGWHDDFRVMAFELLGPSLEDLFDFCGRQFSLKTTLMIVNQLLSRIEHLHARGVVYRDINPRNFLMGTGPKGNQVYVANLGLVTEYTTTCVGTTETASQRPHLLSSTRFASIRGHEGRGMLDSRSHAARH